mgnify:CR=1 FL=1
MELTLNKPVTREIQVRGLSDEQKEKRQVEFVISTEAVDSYGTVFRSDGWDLSRFEKNPIVLYGHRSFDGNPDYIIGTGEVFREDKQLIGKVTFEDETVNPLAEKVFRKVQSGTLRMASIGATPTQGHWGTKEAGEDPEVLYFDRQELLEFSIVPIGSNPDALKRNAEAIDEIKTQFTRNINVVVEPTENNEKLRSIREAQFLINNQ